MSILDTLENGTICFQAHRSLDVFKCKTRSLLFRLLFCMILREKIREVDIPRMSAKSNFPVTNEAMDNSHTDTSKDW